MTRRDQFSLFGAPGPLPRPEPDQEPAAERAADGRSRETALPISELNERARQVLDRAFGPLWVIGEVANWRSSATGHCYFTLRDATAQLSCVMFQGDARRLPTPPEDGLEVFVYGQVSLYPQRGSFELIVRALEPRGEGLWRLAIDRLRRKLAAEGLTDPARKRRLPRLPATVGIVTSRRGAALRDIVTVVRRRAPWTRILIADCRVQGEGAEVEIRRAIELIGRHPRVDVVVVTRGGGSVEDLWCFNAESVARAIAACPVPVVSAVGHEVDVTICDLVADVRAATPSAAAELVVPDAEMLRGQLARARERLVGSLRRHGTRGADRARRLEERLFRVVDGRIDRLEASLHRAQGRLNALSPIATLERGYAVPLGPGGEVLRGIERFPEGERFRLRVADGEVRARSEGAESLEP